MKSASVMSDIQRVEELKQWLRDALGLDRPEIQAALKQRSAETTKGYLEQMAILGELNQRGPTTSPWSRPLMTRYRRLTWWWRRKRALGRARAFRRGQR
jgi:hypothetical protein